MKTPSQIREDITRRLTRTWASDLATGRSSWPHRVPLGLPTKAELEANWTSHHRQMVELRAWAESQGLSVVSREGRVYSTTQSIPTHIEVPCIESAARVAGGQWMQTVEVGRLRLPLLEAAFPDTVDAKVLRRITGYDEVDFELLLTVAAWFKEQGESAVGLTPRQVPVPGVHAKWLNTHQHDVEALARLETLGLAARHPPRIHFTYLDPQHRAAGGRVHDSATVGDRFAPAYAPKVVVISENKDTAIHFPPLDGGIAVEGEGFGGKTAAAFPWLTGAPTVIYWGDIDPHGYEILDGWRADGVPVQSILMDFDTYETYERFGTNLDKNNNPITVRDRVLGNLTMREAEVYQRISSPDWPQHRRIEQERIPPEVALRAVLAAMP